MQRNGSTPGPVELRDSSDARLDRRALTESVAYALWEERKRHNAHDDPEADWYHAEELITVLWNQRPQALNGS
jgi:hypothetical protein